jgi:phosphatidylinositol alpha-mannosyltransferase
LKYLLSAFSKLKWDWPNLRLLVVGAGNPDEDSYRIMSERNLKDVEFLGRVTDEEKARYFKSADIFCSPATGRESFGIVLLEAMAAGKPVVATNIDGYASVITHGEEGLLVEPKSDNALAEAISSLLDAPRLRDSLAERGRKKANEYRWEIVAGKVMDYYETLLESRQPAMVR